MRGSDRLEDEKAPETSESTTEDAATPEVEAAPKAPARRPRARRTKAAEEPAAEAAQAEAPASEEPAPAPARRTRAAAAASESPAAEAPAAEEAAPAPARRTRTRQPRAAAAASEAPAAEAPATEEAAPAPARRTRTRQPRAAAAATEAPAAEAPAAAEAEAPATEEAAPARRTRTTRRRAAPEAAAPEEPAVETTPAAELEPEVPAKRLPRLLERYRTSVKGALHQEFGYSNVMQIPRLEKVVLNVGLGETKTNPRAMESVTRDLSLITGQKPVVTRAKRSISGFKLREGDPIGVAVTLRGNRMYEFMDRLVNASLPRIRDFRGVSRRAFDGRGNYSLGIREQVIFPEIDYGQIDRIRSLQVSIVTTASTDREAMRLLDLMGMPFTREQAGPGGDGNA